MLYFSMASVMPTVVKVMPPSPLICLLLNHDRGEQRGSCTIERLRRQQKRLPYMTSPHIRGTYINICLNFADKQYRFCRQRGGGVKQSQTSVDVIYGSPLPSFLPYWTHKSGRKRRQRRRRWQTNVTHCHLEQRAPLSRERERERGVRQNFESKFSFALHFGQGL